MVVVVAAVVHWNILVIWVELSLQYKLIMTLNRSGSCWFRDRCISSIIVAYISDTRAALGVSWLRGDKLIALSRIRLRIVLLSCFRWVTWIIPERLLGKCIAEGGNIPCNDRVVIIIATVVCLLVQDVTSGMWCTSISVESLVLIDTGILVVVIIGWIPVEMFGGGRGSER